MKRLFIIIQFLLYNALIGQDIYDCKLWGLTNQGGSGAGSVFAYDLKNDTLMNMANLSFTPLGSSPKGSLYYDSNGQMYGLAWNGGTGLFSSNLNSCNGCGTLFSFNPDSGTITKHYDFDYDSGPGGLPSGSLIKATNGFMYGLTATGTNGYGGAIFQYDNTNGSITTRFEFSSATGYGPSGSLLQATDNKLYGMTAGGGSSNEGSLFVFDLSTDSFTKILDFNGPLTGSRPAGDLIQTQNGKLYGLTPYGGTYNNGVLFSYDINTGTFSKLYDFYYQLGGFAPTGSLLEASNGKLYGLTSRGGVNNLGTLFEYNIAADSLATLYNFTSATGKYPLGSLMQADNGKLYGVTQLGGSASGGILFEYDINLDTLVKKADFTYATGYKPQYLRLIEVCRLVGKEDLAITFPNIFTPNGDGINDMWLPQINYPGLLSGYNLQIFNRWGNLVFESSSVKEPWYGNNKSGKICTEGTYFYVANYQTLDKKQNTIKGFITLSR